MSLDVQVFLWLLLDDLLRMHWALTGGIFREEDGGPGGRVCTGPACSAIAGSAGLGILRYAYNCIQSLQQSGCELKCNKQTHPGGGGKDACRTAGKAKREKAAFIRTAGYLEEEEEEEVSEERERVANRK
jgi:hypothetical protein